MIECSSCRTLNSEMQAACLVCGAPLPGARAASGAPPQRCPAGHPFDPSWKRCPYCDRAAAQAGGRMPVGEATRREATAGVGLGNEPQPPRSAVSPGAAGGAAPPTSAPPSPDRVAPRPTRLEPAEAAGQGRRRTVLAPEQLLVSPAVSEQPPGAVRSAAPAAAPQAPPAAAQGAPGDARRLVAVLAAPDLQPGGMVFAVRAGKNTVGASSAADICLARDPKVSHEHALLLFRNGAFLLADRVSTNGTWVNGREVPANGTVELLDRDHIRCGDAELQLLALATGSTGSPVGEAEGESDGARE
jgi:hypothetical protein